MRSLLVVLASPLAFAQPAVFDGGVRNAASYTPPGHLNSGLARGSLIVVFGRNLGPEKLVETGYPLPLELAGTIVRIEAGSIRVTAPLVYVSAAQLAAVLPSNAPLGRAQLTVSAGGQTSAPAAVDIVQRNFGIFTLSQTGVGPAVIQNFESATNQPVNTLLTPARPGQIVTLWGTGLGPVEGPEAARPLPGDLDMPLMVRVGFQPAKVIYKGRSGCCPGVDQIVFEVPPGIEGCYAPVVVVAGEMNRQPVLLPAEGTVSNSGTLAIATNGPCRDATGLTGAELDRLSASGVLRTATIQVESKTASGTASVEASFARLDAATVLRSLNIFGLPPAGTCIEINGAAIGAQPTIASPLDAGALTLGGPGGSMAVGRKAPGYYADSLTQTLPSGSYTLDNGSGTSDVGPFRATFSMPVPIVWTNKSSVLGRSDHTFRWTGGDPEGLVAIADILTNSVAVFGSICVERASAGQLTIPGPEWYAGLLEGRPYGPLGVSVSMSSLGAPVRFSATGLDLGVILPKVTDQRTY